MLGGDIPWVELDQPERDTVIADLDQALPEFWDQFEHGDLEALRVDLKFYSDYDLILVVEPGPSPRGTVVVYAPGDVRPLGDGLAAVERINRVAPLDLNESCVLQYGWFLLCFCADGDWLPVTRLEDLRDAGGDLTPEERSGIQPPRATQQDDSDWHFRIDGVALYDGLLTEYQLFVNEAGEYTVTGRPIGSTTVSLSNWGFDLCHYVRVRPALGCDGWLKPEPDELLGVLKSLDASGELCGPVDIVRRAVGLVFYEPYFLYELLQRSPEGDLRRRYALCDWKESKVAILNRTSPPIHQVNNELGDQRFGKLFEDEDAAAQYLRFFCWAVWGEEGAFYLIRRFREIAWSKASKDLDKIRSDIGAAGNFSYGGFEDGYYRFHALVGYSNALFRAEFRVDWSGQVEMLGDEPIYAHLPVEKAVDAEGPLVGLIAKVDRPEKIHSLDKSRKLPGKSRFPFEESSGEQVQELIRDLDAYLPEFWQYFDHETLQIRSATLPFYPDYRLVTAQEKDGGRSVAALYAPGDVRPINGSADPVEQVNLIAPLELTEENAADYVRFFLTFCTCAPEFCLAVDGPDDLPCSIPPEVRKGCERPFTVRELPEKEGEKRYEVLGIARKGGELRRFRAVVGPDGNVNLQAEGESLAGLSVEQQVCAVRPPAMPFLRMRPAWPSLSWERVERGAERETLEDSLAENGVIGLNELFIRRAKGLDCLRPFVFYEVLERGREDGLQRAHLLFDAERSELRSVNGAQEFLDSLLKRIREHRRGPWLTEVEDAEAYLDFWRWARHEDKKPQRVVRRLRELEWSAAPTVEEQQAVRDMLELAAASEPDQEDESFALPRVFAGGSQCSMAVFRVSPEGKVEPVKSDQELTKLKLVPPPAKSEGLVETPYPNGRVTREAPPCYLDEHCGDPHTPRAPLTPVGLNRLLAEPTKNADGANQVVVADRRLGKRVLLGGLENRQLMFRNVAFEGGLDLTALRGSRSIEFYGCEFGASLNASGAKVDGSLIFYRCNFRASTDSVEARFDNAEINGDWMLRNCTLTGGVFGSDLHVRGDAQLDGIRVHRGNRPFPEKLFDHLEEWDAKRIGEYADRYKKRAGSPLTAGIALQLGTAKIDGALHVGASFWEPKKGAGAGWQYRPRFALLGGEFGAKAIEVRGATLLYGLVNLGPLAFTHSTLHGVFDASSFHVESAIWRTAGGALQRFSVDPLLVRLVVGGAAQFGGSDLRSGMSWGAAVVTEGLSLGSATINGGIFSRHTQRNGLTSTKDIVRLHLGAGSDRKALQLSGLECNGSIELDGPRLDGTVVMTTGSCHRLFIGTMHCLMLEKEGGTPKHVLRVVSPQVESIALTSVNVRDDVRVRTIRVTSRGANPKYYARPEYSGSLLITRCQIGGDLDVGSDGAYAAAYRALTHFGQAVLPRVYEVAHALEDQKLQTEVPGEVALSGSSIGGDVNLTHVRVGERIKLDDVKVGGDILLSRYARTPYPRETTDSPVFETTCAALEMDLLQCGGDLDLTGLRVKSPSKEQLKGRRLHAWEGPPDVSARGVKAGGMILFSPKDGKKRASGGCGAEIEGALNMPAASASRLVLSGLNFEDRGRAEKDSEPRIDIERSTFRRLEILYPLPKAIDLSNVVVDRWEIEGAADDVEPHVDLLDKTQPFKTGTYAQIERAIRQEGDTALADEIYRGMRRRWTREKRARLAKAHSWRRPQLRGWLSWFADVMDGRMIGFGTNPYPLLAFVFALMLPSIAIFSQQENVVASMDVLDAAGDVPVQRLFSIHPEDFGHPWGLQEAFIMTVRYHVPIIGNALHPHFEPTRHPVKLPSWLYLSGSPLRSPPGSVWASSMSWANWLLWPWLLLVIARNIRIRMAGGAG